jgi:hypothetical protein
MSKFNSDNAPTAGRPAGAKNRLSHAFLKALADDFEAHGIEALRICRAEQPATYIKVVAGLMPKEFLVSDQKLEDLSEEEIIDAMMRIRELRAANNVN